MHTGVKEFFSRAGRFWRRTVSSKGPEVIVHDPAAEVARNLDDPFDDAAVQEKVGKILAGGRSPQ